MKHGSGIKGRDDKSSGIEILMSVVVFFPFIFVVTTVGLPNDKRDEHLKNVFSFHFFENIFLGALLAFLCSICTEKNQIFFF